MLHQAAMLIIFFIAAVPKDSQRFSKAVCKHVLFMPSHYVQSMAKPTGSMVENSTPHYVQASVKPAAAWQKNSYKNAKAKVLRQANTQGHQKIAQKNCINTAPTHRSHLL